MNLNSGIPAVSSNFAALMALAHHGIDGEPFYSKAAGAVIDLAESITPPPAAPEGSWEPISQDAVDVALPLARKAIMARERAIELEISDESAMNEAFGKATFVAGLGWFKATATIGEPVEKSATVGRTAFAAALAKACKAVEKRNTIPILSNVLIDAGPDGLYIEATDLDNTVRVNLPCAAAAPFRVTVPAHLLYSIAKARAGGDMTISVTETWRTYGDETISNSEGAKLIAGSSRFNLQTLPHGDFPDVAPGEFPHAFGIPVDVLGQAIDHVSFCISTEETRYYLNGVYLHTVTGIDGSDHLRIIATDGHKLARFEFPGAFGVSLGGVIVHRETLALFQAIMAGKKATGEVWVEISDKVIRLTLGDLRITAKLVDGTYPDYTRVIPQGNDKVLTVDADALIDAIDQVSVIASERGRAVRLSIAENELTLSVKNPDTGSASERLACEYTSDAIDIGFNASYLAEILEHFAPGKRKAGETRMVMIRLADMGSPVVIQAANGTGPLCVLMPMRV